MPPSAIGCSMSSRSQTGVRIMDFSQAKTGFQLQCSQNLLRAEALRLTRVAFIRSKPPISLTHRGGRFRAETKQPRFLSYLLCDGNLTGHVWVELAVIVDCPLSFQNDAFGGVGRYQGIPGAVPCRCGVGHEVGVHPFNRIADVSPDLRRSKGELLDPDLNGLGARCSRQEEEKESAERSNGQAIAHSMRRYLNCAATCSACCSCPWKIFRPVVSRALRSGLVADGISVFSSALSTALW